MNTLLSSLRVISIMIFLLGFTSTEAQVTPQYHNGMAPSNGNSIPLAYTSSGVKGQALYPVGVFGTVPSGMKITKIYYAAYTGSTGSSSYSQLHIALKQDNISSLSSSSYVTGVTNVFSSTSYTISYVGGYWFAITLQTPFLYNPALPLIVEVNQLQSSFTNYYCALSSQGTPTGAWRNYSTSYNATSPVGANAYMTAFGFDLIPSAAVPNDAGVASIKAPVSNCAGTYPVIAKIKNFGSNRITSVTVNWKYNGITQTPVSYTGTLDTANGTGADTALISLGNITLPGGTNRNIISWTTNPNNKMDTVNYNDTANKSISGYSYPNINFGKDTTLCPGEPLELSVSSSYDSVFWSNSSTYDSILISTSGTYSVKVYNHHCMGGDTIVISMHPAAPVINLGNDTTICTAQPIVLNATASGVAYKWFNNTTSATHTTSTAGTYWVVLEDANTCKSGDTIVIKVHSDPTVSLAVAPKNIICYGVPYTFTATPKTDGSINYQWKVNGINAGAQTTSKTFTGPIEYGDTVSVDLITDICATAPYPVPSNKITMFINPAAKLINGISGTLTVIENTTKNYAIGITTGNSYIWRVSGGTIVGDSTSNAVKISWGSPNPSGFISVEERDGAGCKRNNVLPVSIISIVGLDEKNNIGIGEAYPNPANTIFTLPVYSNSSADLKLDLFDVSGILVKSVHSKNLTGNTTVTVAIDDLSNGIYFYKVTSSEGYSVMKKINIQH